MYILIITGQKFVTIVSFYFYLVFRRKAYICYVTALGLAGQGRLLALIICMHKQMQRATYNHSI